MPNFEVWKLHPISHCLMHLIGFGITYLAVSRHLKMAILICELSLAPAILGFQAKIAQKNEAKNINKWKQIAKIRWELWNNGSQTHHLTLSFNYLFILSRKKNETNQNIVFVDLSVWKNPVKLEISFGKFSFLPLYFLHHTCRSNM